jgi:hypothetical protein
MLECRLHIGGGKVVEAEFFSASEVEVNWVGTGPGLKVLNEDNLLAISALQSILGMKLPKYVSWCHPCGQANTGY